MRYYTNSEMGTFRDCRRKWWLGTYRRLQLRARTVIGAAPIGTRVHSALEPWYQPEGVERRDPRIVVKEIIAHDRATLIESIGPVEDNDEFNPLTAALKQFDSESELVTIMIDGYMDWLEETGADSDYRIIASEQSVQYEFAPGEAIAGRIDTQVQRIHDGVLFGMDHKTGDFGALEKKLPQDEQMLLYEILRRLNNPDSRSDGMIFNMLRKVKRSARANPPFFKRAEVRFNQHQLESAWYRVMAIINDIKSVTARLDAGESHFTAAYPRPNGDCSWKCEFYIVCPMFDDGSRAEDMIQSFYVQGDPLERYPDLTGDYE